VAGTASGITTMVAHSGGPPHAKIMEAIKLFGEQVIPHCR